MRVGIDGTILTRKLTGIGVYTLRLTEELAKLSNTDVILFSHREPLVQPAGVETIISRAPQAHLFLQLKLPRLLKKHAIDLLHGPNFYLPLTGKTPKVMTVHDLSGVLHPEMHSAKHRLSQMMFPPSLSRARRIIADSSATASELIGEYPDCENKIDVVHLGVSREMRPASEARKTELREEYALPEEFILFVGTLEPRKNLSGLIRAFARIAADIPQKLVIAGGEGWKFSDIYSLASELGIADSLVFTGYIEDDELSALYSLADVFCYPSLYEGFGLPVLEAMACGTPVVTSNISSMPEVAGDSALLMNPESPVEIAKGILRIIGDDSYRKDLIRRGFVRAEEFTWEETARKTREVYLKALSG